MKHIKTLFAATVLAFSLNIGVLFLAPLPVVRAACGTGGLSIPCATESEVTCTTTNCLKENPIVLWITFLINLVSILVLVGASLMMVYAGVEYITAADNAQRIQAAKKRILNVIIGVVAYFFLFAFLQWLVPGGAF